MSETSQLPKKTWLMIVLAAAIAMFMGALDGTIVNIALPAISQDFGLSTSAVSWVSTIYLLINAGLLFFVGKLITVIGYKKMFAAGFIIFLTGSFACGFFPIMYNSFPLLLVFRVVQAAGGSILAVLAPALIAYFIPEINKAKSMSVVMIMASLGTAVGPTVGGLLTQTMGWSWIFYINIPIGIIAIIIGLSSIPKTKSENTTMKGFDGIGAGLIFAGVAALLFAFAEGPTLGWASVPVIISYIIAAGGIIGFIINERRTKDPVLDLKLFKNPAFLLINLLFALIFFAFAGVNYILPFYLELIKGFSALHAGLILTALSLGLMVAGLIAGAIYLKICGKLKYLLMSGMLLMVIAFFLLSHLSPVSGTPVIIISLILLGFGLGLTTTPLATMILGSAAPNKTGMVSSMTALWRYVPMTIGIAFTNIILIIGVKHIAKAHGITTLPPKDIAAGVLNTGFDLCFFLSMILMLVLTVLCLFISEKKLKEVKSM